MGLTIARARALYISAVSPYTVGKPRHFVKKGGLSVIKNLSHYSLDCVRAVLSKQTFYAVLGCGIASKLRPKVECNRGGFPGRPKVKVFDILSNLPTLNYFDRWYENTLFKGVFS